MKMLNKSYDMFCPEIGRTILDISEEVEMIRIKKNQWYSPA